MLLRGGSSALLDCSFQNFQGVRATTRGISSARATASTNWTRDSIASTLGKDSTSYLQHQKDDQTLRIWSPRTIEDVAAGFAWVKKNIAERGGNPKTVFLMGHSSGAHLSLLLAADPQYLAKHKLSPADIAGVIGLSSPVDLEPRKDRKGFGDSLMAGRGADVFSRNAGIMKAASPVQHITKELPPVLLVVGERDFSMLEGDAKDFVEKAKGFNVAATVFVAKGRDHMGVVKSLIEDKSPVIEQVVAFLGKL